jgi:hypothetical protein
MARIRNEPTWRLTLLRSVLIALALTAIFVGAFYLAKAYAPDTTRDALLVAVVAFGIVGASIFAAMHLGRHEHISSGAHIVQAFVMSTAIGLAGYLYFVQGTGEPHADVTQNISTAPLGNGNIAVEADVEVKNLGSQPLEIKRMNSTLQGVDLESTGPKFANAPMQPWDSDIWNETDIIHGTSGPAFENAELNWPTLRFYSPKKDVNHEIEPQESDPFTVTFLIHCPKYRYVRVATEVEKSGKGKMAWKVNSFVDLKPVCS